MKKSIVLIIGWILVTNVSAQYYQSTTYGVNLYQSSTGSGYSSSYNINLDVQRNQRLFEIGLLLNNRDQHFMGFEFVYKHFTGYKKANFNFKKVRTYFHYNFTFRNPEEIVVNSAALSTTSFDPNMMGGKMTTFEHAVGFGLQVKLFSQMVVDGNLGVGAYFGSKYQGMHPNTIGIHKNNYGFIPSFKLGFGYKF
jgi:hypothetical protein